MPKFKVIAEVIVKTSYIVEANDERAAHDAIYKNPAYDVLAGDIVNADPGRSILGQMVTGYKFGTIEVKSHVSRPRQ